MIKYFTLWGIGIMHGYQANKHAGIQKQQTHFSAWEV
jgi:hypothetical protein